MKVDFEKLLAGFSGNNGVSEDALARMDEMIGEPLPPDFRDLLKTSNGGEGNIGKQYLMIWSAEEIIEYNRQYQVGKYAPGLFLFGSNGGGEGYAFDYRSGRFHGVVMVPFIGMELKHATTLARTFTAFLRKLQSVRPER